MRRGRRLTRRWSSCGISARGVVAADRFPLADLPSRPGGDLILELALAARCRSLVTHNLRDFAGCEKLGIEAVTPGEFIKMLKRDVKP